MANMYISLILLFVAASVHSLHPQGFKKIKPHLASDEEESAEFPVPIRSKHPQSYPRESANVVFSAARNTSFRPTDFPAVVPYEIVTLNEGNGLNETSGIFKAPISGFFWFSFTFRNYIDGIINHGAVCTLFHDGTVVMTGWSLYRASSNLATAIHLKEGEEVWVEILYTHDKAIYAGPDKEVLFSGFLINYTL